MNDDLKFPIYAFGGIGLICFFLFLSNAEALEITIPPTPAFSNIQVNGTWFNATTYNESLIIVTSGGGINNTISSIGTKQNLVSGQVNNDHQLKGLACGGDLQCSNNSTDVTISYTGTPAGSSALDDLTDVIITAPAYLSTLFYNGVEWIDKIFSIDSITCGAGQFVNVLNNQTGATSCGTPSGSGNATNIDDLGDVVSQSVSQFSILYYNGVQWLDQVFKNNNISATCSGTDKVSSFVYDNQTGVSTVTCSTDASGAGATSLGANTSSSLVGTAHTLLWTIPLTANSGNSISGVIDAVSNTVGVAPQFGANTTVGGAYGSCLWNTPITATTTALDLLYVNRSSIVTLGDTAETVHFFPTNQLNYPIPVKFDCSVVTNGTAADLRIFFQAETTGTVTAKAGSYYIKTP